MPDVDGSYYADSSTAASLATITAAMATAEDTRFDAVAAITGLTPKAVADHTLVSHVAGLMVLNTTTGALYMSNGSTWKPIVIGDTGWVDIEPEAGWTETLQCRYRLIGSGGQPRLYMQGALTRSLTSGSEVTAFTALPFNAIGSYRNGVRALITDSGVIARGLIDTSNNLKITAMSTASHTISLSGMSGLSVQV